MTPQKIKNIVPYCIITLLFCAITGLFYIKHHVKELKKDIIATKHQLMIEKEETHILQAEWTYLNEPKRLRQLADAYLQLSYSKAAQVRQLPQAQTHMASNNTQLTITPTLKPSLSSYKVP